MISIRSLLLDPGQVNRACTPECRRAPYHGCSLPSRPYSPDMTNRNSVSLSLHEQGKGGNRGMMQAGFGASLGAPLLGGNMGGMGGMMGADGLTPLQSEVSRRDSYRPTTWGPLSPALLPALPYLPPSPPSLTPAHSLPANTHIHALSRPHTGAGVLQGRCGGLRRAHQGGGEEAGRQGHARAAQVSSCSHTPLPSPALIHLYLI